MKKFNELLVRFKVQREEVHEGQTEDAEHKSFLKLKHKLMANREGKSTSQNKQVLNADTFNLREMRSIPMNQGGRSNVKDIKL